MKKAVYHGIRDIRVEQVPEPEPGPGEAKVRVVYCGICGSDVHEYLHGPFPRSPFGHEVCGEIVDVGSEVEGFAVGDRVVAFNRDGYAETMVAPQNRLLKLPEGISWERAALIEPLSGAAYAVERGGIKASDRVLIAGGGPVGLLVLLALEAIGVETVYLTEISKTRGDRARELGATDVFSPLEVKIPGKMKELTEGMGVDASVEAVGVGAALKDCLASTRHGGTVVVQGIFTDRVPIHMLGFVSREITMIGTNSINPQLALEWIAAGRVEPESIVTRIVLLDDIAAEGFDVLADEKDRDIKILVAPGAS
jgi:(R,R)-butanediol dehydrogenase/meso-butanediol dehydrogenase/diacetyl reductase